MAVCKDRPDDPNDYDYTVFFVNNSDTPVDSIQLKTGGFFTMDDELVQTSVGHKSWDAVPPKGYVVIEHDNEAEGDFDMEIWFNIQLTVNGVEKIFGFSIPKYLRGLEETPHIPVLNKKGYVIEPR